MPKPIHSPAALDNPIWHALIGPHRHLAGSLGEARWYPSAIAPFIAVATVDTLPDLNGALAREFRDPAYCAGVLPAVLPDGWHFASRTRMQQMLPADDTLPAADESDIRVLGIADRPRMLALTRTAFPDYFRERTAELGTYLGIFAGDDLVAMAGERMALDGMQEISGVCTHPAADMRGA
jgi:hypothetical protein